MSLAIIIVLALINCNKSAAESELVKGVFSENIDDVEHEKIIEYGKSGIVSLEEMLAELGININKEDRVKAFPDPSLGIGSRLEILRATPVVINDAGEIKTYYTWKTKVGDLLDEANIPIGSDDLLSVNKDDQIGKDFQIDITRVALSEIKEYEDIDYEIIYKNDPTLDRGLTKVAQIPEYGKKELTYEVRRENGQEISRQLINSEVIKEPVDKIVLKGTKVVSYGSGIATWYDWISGDTAASDELPQGSKVLVRNNANGKEVVVTIVDHGIQGEAIIDLSMDAFAQIASLGTGRISVVLEKP